MGSQSESESAVDSRRSGIACLVALAGYHGVPLDARTLSHEYGEDSDLPLEAFPKILEGVGLEAELRKLTWRQLVRRRHRLPAIVALKNGNKVVISGLTRRDGQDVVVVKDPLVRSKGFLFIPREQFERAWSGNLVEVRQQATVAGEERFGLWWFIREALTYRSELAGVAVAALFNNLFALIIPFFLLVVIDKVLLHQATTTLTALGIGAVAAVTFDAVFTFLRQYLLAHTARNLDRILLGRIFSHALKLPLDYFERHPRGLIVKKLQQVERIRQFVTGNVVWLATDMPFVAIFLMLVAMFSPLVAGIVLLSSVISLGMMLGFSPGIRARIRQAQAADSSREAVAVETLHAVATVKALGIEHGRQEAWDRAVGRAGRARWSMHGLTSASQSGTRLVEQLTVITIIWVGASLVLAGELTIGGLVAMNILARRVTGPLVRLSGVLQDYQETVTALRSLADIMERPVEIGRGADHQLRPDFRGAIELEDVTFRYRGRDTPALRDISITIPAGGFVGIVGASGSGKSTLVKLLAGLYSLQAGTIRYDGFDLREMDVGHLRRSLGFVPQDSMLFRQSIRENIAGGVEHVDRQDIVRAARQAGADDFVARLPAGYDTVLEEDGANLSGGQRQRLILARAFVRDPPVLVLDEMTSALDPESEALIRSTIARMRGQRTLIVVSHRPAMVVDADFLVVLDRGGIAGMGTHRQLWDTCAAYQRLCQEDMPASRLRGAIPTARR